MSSKPLIYIVIATLPDAKTRDEFYHWLVDGHTQLVIKGGASTARVLHVDPTPEQPLPRVMVEYEFATREVFETYVRDHAPALRVDGLKHFPPERGITMQRLIAQ